MKLDRLLSILILLLRKDRVQAKELAEKFEVSTRTILRDIEAINLAGIPVVTYQGVNGGIGIAEGYRLDRSILTSDEMVSVITSLQGMARLIPESQHEVLLEKLKNILNLSQLKQVEAKTKQLVFDPSPWYSIEQINEKLAVIKKAIEDRKEVRFGYLDPAGNETERRVEPYFLLLKGQNWYLYAFCQLRQDFRLFKLTRISKLSVLDWSFDPRTISEEQTFFNQDWPTAGEPVALELVFAKEMKTIVADWFGKEPIEEEDGRILVSVTLPENNWLYGFILSFGSGIEVINPPHIRAIIAEIAREIYQKYTH